MTPDQIAAEVAAGHIVSVKGRLFVACDRVKTLKKPEAVIDAQPSELERPSVEAEAPDAAAGGADGN